MAKKLKFKPTPAGILFLSAIGVLLIAIIILTIVGVSRCKKNDTRINPVTSAEPVESLEPVESVEPSETPAAVNPDTSTEPEETTDPDASPITGEATPASGETGAPCAIVITTPGSGSSTAGTSVTTSRTPRAATT